MERPHPAQPGWGFFTFLHPVSGRGEVGGNLLSPRPDVRVVGD
jgi:hypothetical protein